MFVADLHNDLVQRMMIGENISKLTKVGHTDIPRLENSSIDMQVLIVWVSKKSEKYSYLENAKIMYDQISSLANSNIIIPKTSDDLIDSDRINAAIKTPIGGFKKWKEAARTAPTFLTKLNHMIVAISPGNMHVYKKAITKLDENLIDQVSKK